MLSYCLRVKDQKSLRSLVTSPRERNKEQSSLFNLDLEIQINSRGTVFAELPSNYGRQGRVSLHKVIAQDKGLATGLVEVSGKVQAEVSPAVPSGCSLEGRPRPHDQEGLTQRSEMKTAELRLG